MNFLLNLARHEEFSSANVHTNFIRDHYDSLFKNELLNDVTLIQAALAYVLTDESDQIDRYLENDDKFNPFVVEPAFRVNYDHEQVIKLKFFSQGKNIYTFLCELVRQIFILF